MVVELKLPGKQGRAYTYVQRRRSRKVLFLGKFSGMRNKKISFCGKVEKQQVTTGSSCTKVWYLKDFTKS